MRYFTKTTKKEILEKYEYIIGWGTGGEFRKRAKDFGFLNFAVDTGEKGIKLIGSSVAGIPICDTEELLHIDEEKNLIIIFPNIENEILYSVHSFFSNNVDTIVARLVDCGDEEISYSVDKEDLIMLELINKLGYKKDVQYMDIGVCHPVVRNNTYLFYEMGYKNGVLIEPNTDMCDLSRLYRPDNVIVNCGASGDFECDELTYYCSRRHPGLNTFSKEVAERRPLLTEKCTIEVRNINYLIEKYCKEDPKIIDIDTEGMDFDLLMGIDFDKYNIELICTECKGEEFEELMMEKGYRRYIVTKENTIFLRNELIDRGL